MSRLLRTITARRRTAVAVAVAVLAASVGALAFWAASGTGTASGVVGTLSAPTGVTASSTGTNVSVGWTGVKAPGGGAVDGYYVQRFSGSTPTAACGSSASSLLPAGSSSCTDTSVPPGTYTYKVTAVWRSWTARSSASGSVEVASPSVASTSPSSRGQGASKQVIVVKGSNFASGASASFGAGIAVESTSFVNSTELKATITVEVGAATGARTVTVTNSNGGTGSLAGAFTVNAAPHVESTTPAAGDVGGTENVTVKGTSFVSGATASFGAGIKVNSTTFKSSTEVTANVTVEAGASTGARTVTVTNPDAGTGALASGFTVNGAPTVTSTSPSSADRGGTLNVTIKGSNFESGATSAFGAGIKVNSTSFTSATELTANITIEAAATTGARTVTVTNPDTTTSSLASGFTVNAVPTVTSTSPSSRGQGAVSQNVAVKGTNFESGAAASFGAGIKVNSTSFTSATELTANITVEAAAATGARTVTVTNPDTTSASLASGFTVNAAPTVESASPSSRGQGAANQTVTIQGKGFVSGAGLAVSFSGTGITVNSTTFINGNELTVSVAIDPSAATGARTVTVTNPDGGTRSLVGGFTVNAGPTVESASPSSRGQGASGQTVTIKGANFVSGATASFGTGVKVNSTTFKTSTEVTANVTVEAAAATGARSVTVTNPDAGTGSLAGGFTVNAGPTVVAANPSSCDQGGTENVIVTGTNFVNGAAGSFSGSGITVNSTTFESATQLKLNITTAAGASTGARTVTVTNPDAGTGSLASGFTVNGAPTVTSTSPSSADRGGTLNVTVKGSSFENGATSAFGAGIKVNSTSFTSATELTANITIEAAAATGARTVTITNPDTSTASLASGFTVNAVPTVTSTSPSSRGQGAVSQNVAVKGTNFESGAGASFSGTGITVNSTTFVSATEVTANITVASGAATGGRTVTVTNPDTTTASLESGFTVNAGPTITTPTAASPINPGHNGTTTFTLTGSNFVAGLTVTGNGTAEVTSFTRESSTAIKVTVSGKGENKGLGSFTVTNPDGGKATSEEGSFKNG